MQCVATAEVKFLARLNDINCLGTASVVERYVSQMKQIKTRLHNRITDQNFIHLMRLAIERPAHVNFNEVLDMNNLIINIFVRAPPGEVIQTTDCELVILVITYHILELSFSFMCSCLLVLVTGR